MPSKQVNLVIDYNVRDLCFRPYPLHPKGCPNFGKKASCPPKAPFVEDIIDISKPVYAIWNEFNFGAHIEKMKQAHPKWSQRQLECCLYWQPQARAQLKGEIGFFGLGLQGYVLLTCPEACGVNVTATMKTIGIELEWPPKTITYQVAIAGQKNPRH